MRITHERLKELLHYEPETGFFRWKVIRTNGMKIGQIAGGSHGDGYIAIGVMKKIYLAHRLAWFYMTGEFPANEIDHKDMNRSNNTWSNLREVSGTVNRQNIKSARRHNKTGFLGVHRNKFSFCAQIRIQGKPVWLGSFRTAELAHDAYIAAKRKHHEGCLI